MGQRNYKQVTVYLAFELLLKGDNVVDDKYLAKSWSSVSIYYSMMQLGDSLTSHLVSFSVHNC